MAPAIPGRTASARGCVVLRDGEPLDLLATALADPLITPALTRGSSRQRGGRALVLARLTPRAPVTAAVLEALVELLLEQGYSTVAIGSALSVADRDRGHHSVATVAHAAGLTGRTARGAPYEFVDLSAERVPAPVPATSVLSGWTVSAAWLTADLRIVTARSVTDLVHGYSGTLAALTAAAEEVPGASPADLSADLLELLPPDIAVIDALLTSHGPDGSRMPVESATGVLLVGAPLLADTVLAQLLGIDRSASGFVRAALERCGEPTGLVRGDLTPMPQVSRPDPLVRAAARIVSEDPMVGRVLLAAVGGPDPGAGPSDPLLRAVRTVLTPLVEASGVPASRFALVQLLGAVAVAATQARGWQSMFDKDRVPRVEVPLGFDPAAYPDEEYDGLPSDLAPILRPARDLPKTEDGFQWCLVDGATVFETSRTVRADFAEFVARVDVAEGISLMADYLGGRRVLVGDAADSQTAAVRQAERNLYLPQPNYLALWAGRPIDVCKIELVERTDTEHRLWWRTVDSLNRSATYDDGVLTLTDAGPGLTRLSVAGRQLFALPPMWELSDLSTVPEVRDPLLQEAYRAFFTATFDNLEAQFEGREFRIGRDLPTDYEPLPTAWVQQLLDLVSSWLSSQAPTPPAAQTPRPVEVDIHGFQHFRSQR